MRLQAPEAGFHTVVEQTVTFCEVNYVYTDHFSEALWVHHLEIEPLQITGAVSVIPDPNVILNHGPLSYLVNIAALEL